MKKSHEGVKSVSAMIWTAVLLAAIAAGVYLAEKLYLGPLREQQRLVSNLKAIVSELTRDIRVAEVSVVNQGGDPLQTTFRFVEVDERREPLAPVKVFTISGDVAYFDTLVIKFEDSFMPLEKLPLSDEILRSHLARKAIIFFRRVFSEKQKPEAGFPLDTPGDPPGPIGRALRSLLSSRNCGGTSGSWPTIPGLPPAVASGRRMGLLSIRDCSQASITCSSSAWMEI